MPLIHCEINLFSNFVKVFYKIRKAHNKVPAFTITDTKLYVPIVTLSTQDNTKYFQQLKTDVSENNKLK